MNKSDITERLVTIRKCPGCQLTHELAVKIPHFIHEWFDEGWVALSHTARLECPDDNAEIEQEIVIDRHDGTLQATDKAAWHANGERLGYLPYEYEFLIRWALALAESDEIDPSKLV